MRGFISPQFLAQALQVIMKSYLNKIALLIIGLLICACNNPDSDKRIEEEEHAEVEESYPKYMVDFDSKECQAYLEMARTDFSKGRLVYQIFSGKPKRYSEELEELLRAYHIEYEDLGQNCLNVQECYGYYMDSVISTKYGDSFIPILEKKADSIFLARWETKIYEYWDLDKEPKYSEGYGFADIFIENRVKLPENWDSIPMQHERQFFSVIAIISNKGKLVDWKIDLYNLKETNENHLDYLKKEIDRIVNNMENWEPGELNKRKVASEYHIDIHLDKTIY